MKVSERIALPIPFGWYCVGYSDELAVAEVKAVRYFAQDLVLYRSAQGQACLVAAYCPHLGAHLGHGGTVDDTGLTCPFHGWKFSESGEVAEVSYASQIPPRAQGKQCLTTYPIVEKSGFIFAWYHPNNEQPSFELAAFAEIDSGEWTDYQRKQWTIGTHVQEAGENAVDTAHFPSVHNTGEIMAKPEVDFDGPKRVSIINLNFERIDTEGDKADTEGSEGDMVGGQIHTANVGPGQSWTRNYGIDLLIIGLPTPVESDVLELRFACSVPRENAEVNAEITQLILENAFSQVEQDIPIWEHKIYKKDPLLCDGDGPIAKYRKWFQQFYA